MSAAAAGPRRDAVTALLVFVIALVVAAGLRYRLIEPADMAHACAADASAAFCWLRGWLVQGFQHQEPGWIAAIAGLIGWILAPRGAISGPTSRRLARLSGLLALAFAAIGLMLYSFDPAALGLVLGIIALTRVAAARQGATASR